MTDAAKIRFRCPHCNKGYKVDSKHAGSRAKCSRCSAVIRVPDIRLSPDSLDGSVLNKDSSRVKADTQPIGTENTKTEKDTHVHKEKLYCATCGELLRQVLKSGRPTGEKICIKCSVTPGFCPECHDALRTKLAQQCPHCLSSWHLTVLQKSPEKYIERSEAAASTARSMETETQNIHEQEQIKSPVAKFFIGAFVGFKLWVIGFLVLLINIWPFTFAFFMNSKLDPTETFLGQFASKISSFAISSIYLILGPVSIIFCAILSLLVDVNVNSTEPVKQENK